MDFTLWRLRREQKEGKQTKEELRITGGEESLHIQTELSSQSALQKGLKMAGRKEKKFILKDWTASSISYPVIIHLFSSLVKCNNLLKLNLALVII